MTKYYSKEEIDLIVYRCMRDIDQWEKHDKFREVDSPEGYEPWGIVLARLVVKYDEAFPIEPGESL